MNRLVTWPDKGIEMEEDPRHVDLLLQEVVCEGSKVTTPLIKERIEEALTSEELDEETSAMYRSASMRLAYLSQDRPDLLVFGKELAAEATDSSTLADVETWSSLSSFASENDTPVSESEAIYFIGTLGRCRPHRMY